MLMNSDHRFKIALAAVVAAASMCFAQENRPSPPATADVTLAGKQITIKYSRPSMRGRKIMGEVVPYGQVWRTGANEATTLITPLSLKIGTADVPAGQYTIWTLPSSGTWKLIINKQTGQWGTEYDENQDLVRVDMQKTSFSQPVEQFLISWKKQGDKKADLILEWEKTRLSIPVEAK
jgi:ABC-type molybdate transport system substrate-binding protein